MSTSNSMVNFKQQVVSDDSSSLFFQHQQNVLMSQGTNQIFFDSKAFDKMPSQYQQHND
jgi:hypothetical protein